MHNFFEMFLFLRKTERDMIKMFTGFNVKCLLYLSDFTETSSTSSST